MPVLRCYSTDYQEMRVVLWLPAIALYPILAATYLGGAAIHIEGGGAGRQSAGLVLHYVSFLLAYTVLRLVTVTFVPAPLQQGAPVTVAYLDRSNASFAYQDPSGKFTVHVRASRPVYEALPLTHPL